MAVRFGQIETSHKRVFIGSDWLKFWGQSLQAGVPRQQIHPGMGEMAGLSCFALVRGRVQWGVLHTISEFERDISTARLLQCCCYGRGTELA